MLSIASGEWSRNTVRERTSNRQAWRVRTVARVVSSSSCCIVAVNTVSIGELQQCSSTVGYVVVLCYGYVAVVS